MRLNLEDNCHFINGGSWTSSEYSEEGYPVLKVSNFDKDSISFSELNFLQESSFEKFQKNQLGLHDIVIATVGSHPSLVNSAAGRCITIPKDAVGLLLNQNAVCLKTKNPELINQRYLGYLCKSQLFQHFIQQRGKGAANQMRIPISGIKSFTYDFPQIETQFKIASFLSAYDDLIEKNLKRIKLLEEEAQITYEEWFSIKGKSNDWYDCSIGELIQFHIGGGWGEALQADNFVNPAFVIRGTDMDKLPLGSIDKVPFRWHKESNLKSRKLKHGDIVFEVSGGSSYEGVAKTLLITDELLNQFDGDVMCASFCKLIRPKSSEYSFAIILFLKYLRKTKATEIFEKRSASNIVNYNWEAFLKFQNIKMPNETLLQEFNGKVKPLIAGMYNLGNQITKLKEARSILLPRLMTEMIDVNQLNLETLKSNNTL